MRVRLAVLAAVALALPGVATAGLPEPISRTAPDLSNDAGNGGAGVSVRASSGDGCLRVFSSAATNLVPGQQDLNGGEDVFLHDCNSNTLTLLSHRYDAASTAASAASTEPSISADGRWVAFHSYAPDLLEGIVREHNNTDLYLYDRQSGTLALVNESAGHPGTTTEQGAGAPVFSADSAWMLFGSASTDVLPDIGDDNGGVDQYLLHLASGNKTLVSRRAPGIFCLFPQCTASEGSGPATISADGRFVAFASGAVDLVAGQSDGAGSNDVFVWDRLSGSVVLASHAAGNALQAVGQRSENPSISADGAWVAFTSHASNLVTGQVDANADSDVFLFDRITGVNVLASHAPGSPVTTDAEGWSGNPVLNADGSLLAYTSVSQGLVAGQNDASPLSDDLFLFARATGVNTLVSHTAASATTTGNGATVYARFSGDGQHLVFASRARNLVAGQIDGNDFGDALMGEDIFRHTLAAGTTRLLSHVPGQPARAGRYMSFLPSVDDTGGRVVFASEADDLGPGSDNNDARDVYAWSAADDSVVLLTRRDAAADPVGMVGATEAVASADGRYVAFVSGARNVYAGLVDDDSQNTGRARDDDIFLLDRLTATYVLVSHAASGLDTTANDDSRRPRISGDGRYVVFESAASNLISGQNEVNGTYDVFLFDRTDRSLRLLSHAAGQPARTGGGLSNGAEIARGGSHVVFTSNAPDLIAGSDGNGQSDVFLHDIATGMLRLVSRSAGSDTTAGNGDARFAGLSADGRFVTYHSTATNHVAGVIDFNGDTDVFLFDRDAAGNPNRLVSRNGSNAGMAGDAPSRRPRISADGSRVVYLSHAGNLLTGLLNDGNSDEDVYLFDRSAAFAPNTLVNHLPGQDSATADAGGAEPTISDDGLRVSFLSQATDLVDGQNDSPFTSDLFLYDRATDALTLVSQSAYTPGQAVGAERAQLAGDGSVILFDSRSWELAEGLQSVETESKTWLHLIDAAGSVLLSRSVIGPAYPAVHGSVLADITPDGAVSLFVTASPDIVGFDANFAFPGQNGMDAFLVQRALGVPVVTAPEDQVRVEDEPVGPLAFTVGDPDGDAAQLIVTARSSDQQLVPNGAITIGGSGAERTVSVQPTAEQSGSVTITLRAGDGDGNLGVASFAIEWTSLNDAPGFALPGTVQIFEGESTGLLDFTVEDPDHDENELLLAVSSSDPAVVPTAGIALAGSGASRRVRVTPAPDRFGTVTVAISGEDPEGASGSASFEVQIQNVNDAPAFAAGGDVVSAEDVAHEQTGWATAITAGPFESAQQVSFEVTGNSNPALFQQGPAISGDGTLAYTPAAEAAGSATITVRARDDGGIAHGGSDASATQSFQIEVTAGNDPPTVAGAAQASVEEDGSVFYSFTVGDAEDGPDALAVAVATSDPVLLPLAGLQPGGSGATRTLQITPAPDLNGNAFVFLTVTDAQGAMQEAIVEVVVAPVDEQVDLVTTLDNHRTALQPGETVTWEASVANIGADTAYDVVVADNMPPGMTGVAWTCTAFDGASCGADAGTGAVMLEADLPPDSYLDLVITATLSPAAAPWLDYALQATADAQSVEATPGDNLALDADPVGDLVFGNGFE